MCVPSVGSPRSSFWRSLLRRMRLFLPYSNHSIVSSAARDLGADEKTLAALGMTALNAQISPAELHVVGAGALEHLEVALGDVAHLGRRVAGPQLALLHHLVGRHQRAGGDHGAALDHAIVEHR